MATPFTQCARGQSQCNHTGHAFHSSGCTRFLQGEEADDDEEEDEGRKNVTDKYVGVNVSDSAAADTACGDCAVICCWAPVDTA